MRLLLVDDDKDTALTIKEELARNYITDIAFNGENGEYQAYINEYDLIILDLLLPDINGIEVCRKIRRNGIKTPILMLTGHSEIQNKITALDSGADDYLTKPFDISELLARIRAILRRQTDTFTSNTLAVGNLEINLDKKTVTREDRSIFLRRKEFDLLEYLVRNRGKVLSRTMILDHVWENVDNPGTNTIDVHIKYLRDRIDRPFDKKLIKTIRGFGYKIET